MAQDLEQLSQRALDAAHKAGALEADVLCIEGTSLNMDIRAGALEQAERAEGIDIGLRVLMGQKQACVSVSNASDRALTEMAERAVAMAIEAPDDENVGLAEATQLSERRNADGLDMHDPAPEPTAQNLEDWARTAEAAALSVEGITQVESASAGFSGRRVHLAATNGFSGGYARTDTGLFCVAITGTGTEMERDYFGESRIYAADLPDPSDVGRIAAERTLARAGARKPPTGMYPVLFDERIAASLPGHLLGAVNGSAIARGASWARELLGEQVLPRGISLIEDPLRPRTGGSRPFDGEGLATRKRAIIDDGILTGWVLDLATGRKLGLESTANAGRAISSPPSPLLSNVAMTQGTASRDDLIAQMGTGLLVTSMIGSTINPNTGDYSRGASGFWVENGEIAYPVNECTMASNLKEMLLGLTPANDARPHLSRVVPSLLVESMTIAGD